MKKITKRMYALEAGTIIYRENRDCSYHKITGFSEPQGWYDTVVLDDEGNETKEEDRLTPDDLIGDYLV